MPNRVLCEVLGDMRKCYETRNFAYLNALIEEAQYMGNRMEAALGDKRDIEYYTQEARKLKDEINDLRKKKKQLVAERDSLRQEIQPLRKEREVLRRKNKRTTDAPT